MICGKEGEDGVDGEPVRSMTPQFMGAGKEGEDGVDGEPVRSMTSQFVGAGLDANPTRTRLVLLGWSLLDV